jgi:ABC-type Na+ efflux pump permease subunit
MKSIYIFGILLGIGAIAATLYVTSSHQTTAQTLVRSPFITTVVIPAETNQDHFAYPVPKVVKVVIGVNNTV